MYHFAIEIDLYSFYRNNLIGNFELREKNDRLPNSFTRKRWFISLASQGIGKSRHFVYLRALITRKLLRSKDAQCNSRESPKFFTYIHAMNKNPIYRDNPYILLVASCSEKQSFYPSRILFSFLSFLTFALIAGNNYHTLASSTSTSLFWAFSSTVSKLSLYWMSSSTTPLQVFPSPHFLGALNRSASESPGSNLGAPGLLLVATSLSKVVYWILTDPSLSSDTSLGGSPRRRPSSKLSASASKKSFVVCWGSCTRRYVMVRFF